MLLTLAETVTSELVPKSITAWRNNVRYHREVQEGGVSAIAMLPGGSGKPIYTSMVMAIGDKNFNPLTPVRR